MGTRKEKNEVFTEQQQSTIRSERLESHCRMPSTVNYCFCVVLHSLEQLQPGSAPWALFLQNTVCSEILLTVRDTTQCSS